jgi:hypothetical protein
MPTNIDIPQCSFCGEELVSEDSDSDDDSPSVECKLDEKDNMKELEGTVKAGWRN